MPSLTDLEQFLVTGLSLGGVYALSGVGMIVLYRATGVLNLAFGAVGAMGALIAWQLINHSGFGFWPAFVVSVLFGGVVTLAYGMVFGPALAGRDPLVKATATLGLTLILLGVMDLLWPSSGGASRAMHVPTDNNTLPDRRDLGHVHERDRAGAGARDHDRHRRVPALHKARYGDARDGQRSRDHGHAGRPGEAGDRGRLVRLRVAVRRGRRAARGPGRARCDHADIPRHLDARRHPDRAPALDRRSRSSPRS